MTGVILLLYILVSMSLTLLDKYIITGELFDMVVVVVVVILVFLS